MFENIKSDSISSDPHHLRSFPYQPTWFDQLAMSAMSAIITACSDSDGNIEYDEHQVAKSAYEMAAAMLDARVDAHQRYAAKHYK
jgi:hypothetical protein